MRYRKILAPPPNICLDFVLQRAILLILAGCKNDQIKDMNAYMS